LDLTVYLLGPTEEEFDYLLDVFESVCPPARRTKYKTGELGFWADVARPALTDSGRSAAAAGRKRPYFEPVRRRIRDGRGFEAKYWDGRPIGDPNGSWSFSCRCMHLRSSGLYAFARIIFPLNADLDIVREMAGKIAENVRLYSGHGGLSFVYHPWLKLRVFNAIYALARRYWGVDVEDLNDTLFLMKAGIKGVNWITLVPRVLSPSVAEAINRLRKFGGIQIDIRRNAIVLVAGPQPVAGDQHRPDRALDPYYAEADALKPLYITAHPDFPGRQFINNGNTIGWIRRFVEPSGWR